MSDDGPTIHVFDSPTGRRLDSGPTGPRGYQGTIGVLRPFSKELGRQLRRKLTELDPRKLAFEGKSVRDTATGDEYVLALDFIDPIDPTASGVEAFCVRDGLVLYLRPRGAGHQVEVIEVGEMRGGRV